MKLLRKLAALFRPERRDAEMREELRIHLELQARENIARGCPRRSGDGAAGRVRFFPK